MPAIASRHVAIAALLATGCAPLPMHVFVPVVDQQDIVYSTCAFNRHVPVGGTVAIGKAMGMVLVSSNEGRTYVEARLDVPLGTTLQFAGDAVTVAPADSSAAYQGRFPSISRADRPIVNSYSASPVMRELQLPMTAPMEGARVEAGSVAFNRHFWLAAYVETGGAKEFVVTLPVLVENGAIRHRVAMTFRGETVLGVALFNC